MFEDLSENEKFLDLVKQTVTMDNLIRLMVFIAMVSLWIYRYPQLDKILFMSNNAVYPGFTRGGYGTVHIPTMLFVMFAFFAWSISWELTKITNQLIGIVTSTIERRRLRRDINE